MENNNKLIIEGLTDAQVKESRAKSGANEFKKVRGKEFYTLLIEIISEPMFLLLVAACVVYFLVKQYSEGIIMLLAMLFVASISFFQERRSRKALEAVRKLSAPKAKVYRNGKLCALYSEEIVVDDLILVEEGEQVPADGIILQAHDFTVDESILTGESVPADKNEHSENNNIYLGSTVRSGNAVVKVAAVGTSTMLGKLGQLVEDIKPRRSRFQNEIRMFVRIMAVAGIIAFLFVFGVNYFNTHHLLTSLLFALALAMSILPEEIPVAFSAFMALGAYRLLKKEVLVKDPQVIETLGSATVICIDKTGTITENRMSLACVFSWNTKEVYSKDALGNPHAAEVIDYAMWSSEPAPFDPMEMAIHDAYKQYAAEDFRNDFEMIHEYPLDGTPPVMTHIYENVDGKRIVACKGGAESVIRYSGLSTEESELVFAKVKELASQGYRVLGVASALFAGNNFPKEQKDFQWNFLGLVALYDPPKKNIAEVIGRFYEAGIQVKIISGDFPETTCAIANEIGFRGTDKVITGNELMSLNDAELQRVVTEKNIFARMFPNAKLRVVNALKSNGEIVAMTGDGVNDGPALKAADIGVSMGSKGTEIAKRAASVILLNNDLDKMFNAIVSGRKIYENLKKAIRYILSIHISIITVVVIPLLLDWEIVNIFSPIHIIFFELIMGPTCSIIYENEPGEKFIEKAAPRASSFGFLKFSELSLSIVQGLVISAAVLLLYYVSIKLHFSESLLRTMVFSVIIFANIFLTMENRSFKENIWTTIQYKNSLIVAIILVTVLLFASILYLPWLRDLFYLELMPPSYIAICAAISFVSVFWLELFKLVNGSKSGK